jgi:hypothetical protein
VRALTAPGKLFLTGQRVGCCRFVIGGMMRPTVAIKTGRGQRRG